MLLISYMFDLLYLDQHHYQESIAMIDYSAIILKAVTESSV